MRQLLETLRNRVVNMLRRAGVVSMAARRTGDLPRIQVVVMAGEVKDGVPVMSPFGFAARVLAEDGSGSAETLLMEVSPNHQVALPPADRRHLPPDLEPGEVVVFDDLGQMVHLKRDGMRIKTPLPITVETEESIRMVAPAGIRLDTPNLDVTGEITDRRDTDGRSMSEMRDVHNGHVHPENDGGGPTDTPSEEM